MQLPCGSEARTGVGIKRSEGTYPSRFKKHNFVDTAPFGANKDVPESL